MNYLTEFDLNTDIVLIVYMLCAKILFFLPFLKVWYENLVKSGNALGIRNKQIIIIIIIIIIIMAVLLNRI